MDGDVALGSGTLHNTFEEKRLNDRKCGAYADAEVALQVGGNYAGVHGVGCLSPLGQPSREVSRKKKVCKLGLTVCAPRIVALLAGEVIELDAFTWGAAVQAAAEHDDPTGIRELIEEIANQQMVADVVGEEL